MKLIYDALKENNLKVEDLPAELQESFNNHKQMVVTYNEACERMEEEYPDEADAPQELVQQLDEQEDFIANEEIELAGQIREFANPSPAPPAPEPPAPPAPEPPAPPAPEPPAPVAEKKNSVGWLIFGGAVLLLTVGAVNVLKKR